MKKRLLLLCIAALLAPMSALSEVNVNVNLGLPIPVPPPRVFLPPPPAVLFERPPLFLAPPRLGIYVGVDVPYDIVFAEDFYYLNYRNGWYRSGNYNGPWVTVRQERLPLVVRRQGVEYIRVHRDREFRNYRRDQDHYRGKRFWAGREVRENRREERHEDRWGDRRYEGRNWKEERKHDRQEWKEDRKRAKEELKQERKWDKEERKMEKEERKEHGRR